MNSQYTVDPKTPQRRNHISKTSEFKDMSEKVKKEIPYVAPEIRESDSKSVINTSNYASVKKELRNK